MIPSTIIINNRYKVDKATGEVVDLQTYESQKLEPRLTKLIILFIAHSGEVLNREYIIKEIWNDYPGGSEGLNQAVSFLRKLLNDNNKQIIKTIPKTGYSFHGTISKEMKTQQNKPVLTLRKLIVPAAAGLLGIILSALIFMGHSKSASPDENTDHSKAAAMARADSAMQARKFEEIK